MPRIKKPESIKKPKKAKPGWSDLKLQLSGLDRKELLKLVQDLYAADKDNQTFLHARFNLGDDVLKPYKKTIDHWVGPDVNFDDDLSVSKAKKAISDYRKAVGRPEGLAELSVYYCEACNELLEIGGLDDEGYYNALSNMFEQALKLVRTLDPEQRDTFVKRLDRVRITAHDWGWGVGDDMDYLMEKYGFLDVILK